VDRYNAKFAKAPARPHNLHRALNVEPDRLAEIFCLRDKRYVTKDLTIKYDRKRIKLEVNDLSRGLVGKYVDVYELADGRIQVRAKGVALPHSILNPERRITPSASVRFSHTSRKNRTNPRQSPKSNRSAQRMGTKRPTADRQGLRLKWKHIMSDDHSRGSNLTSALL